MDMFASFEGRDNLARVQVMTGGDDDSVDLGVAEYLVFVGGTVAKAEFVASVASTEASGGADANEFDTWHPPHGREQGGGGEVAGTQ